MSGNERRLLGDADPSRLVADFSESIAEAHDRLGHSLGWRFLYGPSRTLVESAGLALVGLNPGGAVYRPPSPSVEEGNAYRIERWGSGNSPKPLQVQVRRLFATLADPLGAGSAERLMDGTITLNFCPFRAPSWDRLASPAASVAFSKDLWVSLLEVVSLRVVICLGADAARHVAAVLEATGHRASGEPVRQPVGWGSQTYGEARYRRGAVEVLLVRLPHLSRFGIFGRPASEPAIRAFTASVAKALRP